MATWDDDDNIYIDQAWLSTTREFRGDSDRASAIVGCALLDDHLGELLTEFLVQNQDGRSDLLSSDSANAPLGSFGARILAAYAIGLITKTQRDALQKVKKIRNAFAHKTELTFADQSITAHCEAVAKLCPTNAYECEQGQPTPRQLYEVAVAYLTGTMTARRHVIRSLGVKGTVEAVLRTAGILDAIDPTARRQRS